MSKLNKSKKELLACLDEWIKYIKKHLGIDSHSFKAYQQIYQIIQNQPEVTEEWYEEKARELLPSIGYKVHGEYLKSHIEIAKDFIRSIVEEMPAKKATVSEELISKYVEKFREYFVRGFSARNHYKGLLKNFIKEADMEIVKK